jgi:hypothetical protein
VDPDSGAVAFENLSTQTIERDLPTEPEFVVSIPPPHKGGASAGPLGILFEPNFSGLQRHGWRSGRRGSGYDAGAVVKGTRPGSFAATHMPRLRPGHHLIAVNGSSVLRCTFDATMALLKAATRPMVLRFHDPFAVPAPVAAACSGSGGPPPLPRVQVGPVQLPTVPAAVFNAPSIVPPPPELSGVTDATGAGGGGSSGSGSSGGAPVPVLPKKVLAMAQQTLSLALDTLCHMDVAGSLRQSNEAQSSAGDADAAGKSRAEGQRLQRALGETGFLRALGAIATGISSDAMHAKLLDVRVASDLESGPAMLKVEDEDDALADQSKPTTSDMVAIKAVKAMGVLTACNPEALNRPDAAAYDPMSRPVLLERARKMADVDVFKKVIDAVATRDNRAYASSAVDTVSTILRVYDLNGRDNGLAPSNQTTLQTAMRKQEFLPALEGASKLLSQMAASNSDQDGRTFIEKCTVAARALHVMSESGLHRVRGPDGRWTVASATGILGDGPSAPLEAKAAMQACVALDRAARFIDDGSIVLAPDGLAVSMGTAISRHINDPFVCACLLAALARLCAHPVNALQVANANLVSLAIQAAARHQTVQRVAESCMSLIFNVGRDLDNSPGLLEVGVVNCACHIGRAYLLHATNAGGTPIPFELAPAGYEAELGEAIAFQGPQRYVRDRNAVRPRLVRSCVNIMINLACWRAPNAMGMTSVDMIMENNAIPLLGEIIRTHIRDAGVVTSVLNCTANIAFKNQSVQMALGLTLFDAVVLAGYEFQDDVQLMSMALRTIGNLTNQDDNIYRALGYGAARMISSAVMRNINSAPLASLAASVLSNIASIEPVDEETAKLFSDQLLMARASRVDHAWKSLHPTRAENTSLQKLFTLKTPIWSIAEWIMLNERGVEALACAMTHHSTDGSVVEACLRTLLCVAGEDDVAVEMVNRHDIVSRTLFVMRASDFDVSVQLSGATLLQMIAAVDEATNAVRASEVAHALCSAIENHKNSVISALSSAVNAIASLPPQAQGNGGVLIGTLASAIQGKPMQVMQLLARVLETLQLVHGSRAAKTVIEMNTCGGVLQIMVVSTAVLNALARRGMDINTPSTVHAALQNTLQLIHAGALLLSHWLQPPVGPRAAACGYDDRSLLDLMMLRSTIVGSERLTPSLLRLGELCVLGTGEAGDPARPAIAAVAARPLIDMLCCTTITSLVLPIHQDHRYPRTGHGIECDSFGADQMVRLGGFDVFGSLVMAYCTDVVQRAASSPSPDTVQLTSRLMVAELLTLVEGLLITGSDHALSLTAQLGQLALGEGPLDSTIGRLSASATALTTILSHPGFMQLDDAPSPLKITDITDLARRVLGRVQMRVESNGNGITSKSSISEPEAAAIFGYSISRARQLMANNPTAFYNTPTRTVAPYSPAASSPGAPLQKQPSLSGGGAPAVAPAVSQQRAVRQEMAARFVFEITYWAPDFKNSRRAIIGASADQQIFILYDAKTAQKDIANGLAVGSEAMAHHAFKMFQFLAVSSIRIGLPMLNGHMQKSGGLFKSSPKPERCLCIDGPSSETFCVLEVQDVKGAGQIQAMMGALLQ